MFRTAFLILSGNGFASLMMLMRSLLVARMISVEDYGVAATFAISMAIVEMMSVLGLQQMIVQDRDGNNPHLQAALQGFHFLRALVAGAALFLLAYPIAWFLGIPELTWAYQLLALVPVLKGLEHFDIHRLHRRMRYLPGILTRTVPALVSVLLVWPLFELFGDYRVMLYAMMAQWILGTLVSHLVAERRYRLVFDRTIMLRSLRFGWPLLVNGVLMFVAFHGEKLIVGREIGLEALAVLAMGFTLTLSPTLVLAGSAQQFFFPQLSAAKEETAQFDYLAIATYQYHLLMGMFFVVVVMFLGPSIVLFLLGEKYESLIPLLTWLAILHGLRLFKGASSTVALARAKTGNAMMANLPRVLSLPLAWYVAVITGDLLLVIWIAILGEIVGFVISLALVQWRAAVSLQPVAPSLSLTALLMLVAATHAWFFEAPSSVVELTTWAPFFALGLLLVSLIFMGGLRNYVSRRAFTGYSE